MGEQKNPARDAPVAQELKQPFRPIDAIRTHFGGTRRSITVAEWTYPDGTPVTFYFGRLSADDLRAAVEKTQRWEERDGERILIPGTQMDRDLHLLIAKAEDADGKPLFASGDIHLLRRAADIGVLNRVLDFLRAGLVSSIQEAKQALEPTPTSVSSSS